MSIDAQRLLNAAGRGNLARVRECIAFGMSINAANAVGYTALMSSARSYRVEVVEWLISQGADVNAKTHDGQTVLHAAVGETPSQPERQAACVAALLEAGANPDVQTPTGYSPLMRAAWFGCFESARVLIDHDADSTLEDQQGQAAAQIAATRGHEEIRELLET